MFYYYFEQINVGWKVIKDTHREKSTLKLNSSAYEKYEDGQLDCWYIKLTLFKRF